jgi:hypothetical protein
MTRPQLLVIGTGAKHYREYLLRSIASGFRIHLFTGTDPTWEKEYADGWTVLTDTLDTGALVTAARELDPAPDGVLCWDEARILQTAHVAEALGLPGSGVDAVGRCRDKHLTRSALAAAGVPQPESVLVGTVEDALAAAGRIGYPVVLKPRALAASLGVILADGPDDVREHFAFARDTTVPEAPHYDVSVLVEEYADGPEISVDCCVFRGTVTPYCLAHKQVGYPPYFEEVGHVVDGADPLLTEPSFLKLLSDVHVALDITDCMTHVEFRLTPDGPKLIEVNARIGGDMIPYLGLRTNGVDPGLAAAAVACGIEPRLAPGEVRCGAVGFSYVPVPMEVGSIGFEGRLPAEVDLALVLHQPGAKLAPPPEGTLWGRTAFVTAFAATTAQCTAAVEDALAALHVEPAR